jgi:hypothetical protein
MPFKHAFDTTGATSGAGTAYHSRPFQTTWIFLRFLVGFVLLVLIFCVCFIDRCLLSWPLCCLFVFDIRILIIPLLSSNSSYFNSICPSCIILSVKTQCRSFVINLKLYDHDHAIFSPESIYIPHFASLVMAFSIWLSSAFETS